jgi:chromosome segregation ATPase
MTAKAISMKKQLLVFLLIGSLLIAAPVCAEIYKYIDENGQKRWTDDLSQVPKEQRPTAQRVESIDETPADVQAEPEPQSESKTESKATDEPEQNAELNRKALEKEKADLDVKYQQLLDERKQLEQMKTEPQSKEDRATLKERISAYNTKTERYEAQLNEFNKKIQAYNKQIMAKQPSPQSE